MLAAQVDLPYTVCMGTGFLGTDASLMMDVIVCALAVLVPLLLWSLFAVKRKRDYALHRRLQLVLLAAMVVAVVLFEVDTHVLSGGWKEIVSRHDSSAEHIARTWSVLRIHLVFAIATLPVWISTTVFAMKHFGNPPQSTSHRQTHAVLGWTSAAVLATTAVTGVWFYVVAFTS